MKLGFDPSLYETLAKVEENNFWFRARNRLIIWTLSAYCQKFSKFLEIGCGTGYVVSSVVRHFPNAEVTASEYFEEGLKFARLRVPSATFLQMDARNIPFESHFDAIGVFDVLEHIEEDQLVLAQIFAALKQDGVVIITVPQHRCLWSQADEIACHVRRYEAEELTNKIKQAGFEIIRTTSFVSLLLPIMFVSRYRKRTGCQRDADQVIELRLNSVLNKLLELVLELELSLIKIGISFPMGGSRLVVAKKSSAIPEEAVREHK